MANQLVRLDDRSKAVQQLFTINNLALENSAPRTMGDPKRLLRIAFNAIAYDDKLVQCTHASLMGGVFEAIKLGLTLGGPMQEAWLVPFYNNKIKALEAVFIPGYQGYRNLIDRSRAVLDLHPRAVYAGDGFDVEFGSNPRVWHKPHWMLGKDQGEFIAAYAVARLRGGGLQLEVMPRAEIDEHRARSRAKDSGPWVTDYVPMAMKTTIRKISKYLPKSSEAMARLLDLDEKADLGLDQKFDLPEGTRLLDGEPTAPGDKPRAVDALKKVLAERTGSAGEPAGAVIVDVDEENKRLDREIAEREARGDR